MKISTSLFKKSLVDKATIIVALLVSIIQLLLIVSQHIQSWHADMFVSFAPYVVFTSFVLGLFLLLVQAKTYSNILINILLIVMFGLTLFNFQSVNNWLYSGASAKVSNSSDSLKVASFNKLVINKEIDDIREAISSYDIVAISEITKQDFSQISKDWQYSKISNCQCDPAYGVEIAIFSKYEIGEPLTTKALSGYGGSVRAEIKVPGEQRLIVYAVHPPAPVSNESYKNRDEMLAKVIAPQVNKDRQKPVILMGDMNISPYSKGYREFTKQINSYKNVGRGGNVWRTWCLGQLKIACAPIDHIFVSDKLSAKPTQVIEVKGSDHMLIATDIMIK